MSESPWSGAHSPDVKLEHALREAVRKVYESGDLEHLTIKRIRKSVEEQLDLEEDFFRNDNCWKDRSKTIIQSEVDAHSEANASSQPRPPSPIADKRKAPSTSKPSKPASDSKQQGTKRSSTGTAEAKPKKERKKAALDVKESVSVEKQSRTTKPTNKGAEREPTVSPEPGTDEEEGATKPEAKLKTNGEKSEASDSEMSVLLDEDPKIKKIKRRKSDPKPKTKKTETSRPKRPSDSTTDPEAEEIKRLQGWLIKCGIRKMWYKELASCDSSKAKVKHLKEMLAEAGMTGRYSKEKADQIREERELKADLEAVQQGEKSWGKAEGDAEEEGGGGGRPQRRLARGLQGLDFLNDDDGEETD